MPRRNPTHNQKKVLSFFEKKRAWNAATLKQKIKDVDLVTIYRNLKRLEEDKIIVSVTRDETGLLYEKANRPHHAHRRCPKCSGYFCIPCPLKNSDQDHKLEMIVACKKCLINYKK